MNALRDYPSRGASRIHNEDTGICDSAEEDINNNMMEGEEIGWAEHAEMETDAYSVSSGESEEEVDPAVQEDMDKFVATFKGIKDQFRLINRIGEGQFILGRDSCRL